MNFEKVSLAYFSPTLSTKTLMQRVAKGLSIKAHTVQLSLTNTSERQKERQFGPSELLIAGVPSYGGRIPQVHPELFENFMGYNTPAVLFISYGVKGYDDTLLELKDVLTQKGFVCIAAAAFVTQHACSQKVGAGRPDTSDLEMAENFGMQVREKLDAIPTDDVVDHMLTPPGKFPYVNAPGGPPFSPITNEKCILCMQCYRWCPTDAIPYNDPTHTYVEKCIHCLGCVRRCPVDAREITVAPFLERVGALEAHFADAHPAPELFL